ncbi:MAG: ABC-type transport auxiliary lipoprotein family protein [Proteobacteria bacterium]|nr:ABC-type transport auxiliary lipoprotein family protein [Pseudomonadota bacterium]
MKNLILLILIVLISACSSSSKKATEKLYYRFPDARIITLDKNIVVKRPTAMGIIGNRPMVVQNDEGALKQMHHNFWLDSPKVLLHNFLLKIFSNNLPNNSTQKDIILNSQILKLEKKQSIALLEIKFTANNLQGEVVFNKTYSLKTSLASDSNTIHQFVTNIGEMLEQITNQLVEDLR